MAPSLKGLIVEKLEQLPGPALKEVLDFIECLSQRKSPSEDPILAVSGMLAGSSLSADDIERELYGESAQ
ncbi:MAG: DUF2281 domain-containing protein [Candidatus Methylomirabilota bacterium]